MVESQASGIPFVKALVSFLIPVLHGCVLVVSSRASSRGSRSQDCDSSMHSAGGFRRLVQLPIYSIKCFRKLDDSCIDVFVMGLIYLYIWFGLVAREVTTSDLIERTIHCDANTDFYIAFV